MADFENPEAAKLSVANLAAPLVPVAPGVCSILLAYSCGDEGWRLEVEPQPVVAIRFCEACANGFASKFFLASGRVVSREDDYAVLIHSTGIIQNPDGQEFRSTEDWLKYMAASRKISEYWNAREHRKKRIQGGETGIPQVPYPKLR